MKMRLSTRLTLFFLATLAVVLAGFSVALYVLAAKYLHRQADERLEAALNTLVAAAEIGPEGVEWEPDERSLTFGRRTIEGQFSWRVGDDRGQRLDGSSADEMDRILAGPPGVPGTERHARSFLDRSEKPWRVLTRRLDWPEGNPRESNVSGQSSDRHSALVFGAAVSLEGVILTLRNLALALVGLTLGIWTLALVFVRRLCRTALRPVTMMAEAARAIGGHGPDERLPNPETGDELQELGRSFNDLLDRLHESFDRQRQFTGDASHQLRTPLTAIQGQVDLALRQERSAEEYRRVLYLVQRKTRHVRQIVESLLFLARADADAQRPQMEPIELSAWVRDHLQGRTGPRASDVRLEACSTGVFWVWAQHVLLGELLDNLLENAEKYSEPGTPIIVDLRLESDVVTLAVEDSGIGIAEGEITHVFEPFYRSPEARRRGSSGLGLGLSVASRLSQLFGGRLDAQSQPNRGSRFTLTLPLTEQPGPNSIALPGSPVAESDAETESPKLVVLRTEST